ncbi:PQQ-like beta-propeller repeat protein [Lentibacter sp. XHP0401]|uniref:outer membrane protein assembly factor BamB family protein n=1 Tax=Lentibacter sp. XHP0401 TaxID=2984334 RepID=UPI0021E70D1C|nr:PQQ-like beta-propeller repeat protein [Lentibacter sp. XHP0401]MCV2891794.1 PQQ-like beta-propeller repeat protein [Lentibacter sp. XHP0401]
MKSGSRKSGMLSLLAGGAALLLLSACEEPEVVLAGKREALRAEESNANTPVAARSMENRSLAVSLVAPQNNAGWFQRHNSPHTRVSHPAFSGALEPLWSADIGAGDSRSGRITSEPVVAAGKVFTLDSEARVTATSVSGAPVWNISLVPPRDAARDATGGGIAFADGALFVSSGFGLVTALDANTGQELWQQKLQASATGMPTVKDGIVYLVAGDSTAWALDTNSGRILWQLGSAADKNNVLGGPAPAVNDNLVVFSFGSNELQAAFRQGGLRIWDAAISGQRVGFSRSRITDITGDPVIVGDKIYAGTFSGRTVALDTASGERIWTAEEGPMSPVWVAGGSVFMVTDNNELVRLDATNGERIWGTKLPFFVKDRPKRQKTVFTHYGPVLAGGRLYVASNDGLIRVFNPEDGSLIKTGELPSGAATSPVFAGGVMYVVNRKGQLFAFR